MPVGRRKILAGAAGLAALSGIPGLRQARAADVTLKYAHQLPITDNLHKAAHVFAERVQANSGKAMRVQLYPAAQLLKDTETVEGVINGVTDIGSCNTAQWEGVVNGISAHELPFLFKDLKSVRAAFEGEYGRYIDQEMEKRGAKRLMYLIYGFVEFANRGEPLKTPSDFKGKKVRVYSKLTADVVTLLGGAPVFVPGAEQYIALQRGVVDAATTNTATMVSRKYSEVTKAVTITYYSVTVHAATMNLARWNALPPDQQRVLLSAAREAEDWMSDTTQKEIVSNIDVLTKQGMTIHEITPDARKLFMEATASLREEFIAKHGDLGKRLLALLDTSSA